MKPIVVYNTLLKTHLIEVNAKGIFYAERRPWKSTLHQCSWDELIDWEVQGREVWVQNGRENFIVVTRDPLLAWMTGSLIESRKMAVLTDRSTDRFFKDRGLQRPPTLERFNS